MFHKVLTATAIAVMAGTTFASNYCFPSANPPGGKKPEEIKQFVSFIWDDNAYSGLAGTMYETGIGDGYKIVTQAEEGSWGMSWAVRKLAGERKNPDGSDISMTFTVISGQMIPVTFDKALGDYKGYKDKCYKSLNWNTGKEGAFPVAWGREQPYKPLAPWHEDGKEYDPVPEGAINMIYKETLEKGHEIGNHTIDHMETNSPLPKDLWPNGGDGFDTDPNENEANEYWEKCGWIKNAGKIIKEKTWDDAHAISEELIEEHLGITPGNGIDVFRAPRLEINSGCLYSLKKRGYKYDCSLEEGYETHRDGSNFIWPYTMDNGSLNAWTQKSWGSPKAIDSTPAGLWQYPVNVMIVPKEIRDDVAAFRKKIAKAENSSTDYIESWKANGKITGFDFNLFVYWGMTGEQVAQTMKHTLDLRMAGNRAPMQVGCHTDYFSPIYDNSTLKGDKVFKLTLERNTYKDRIKAYEDFADYALEKGAYLLSGTKVIDSVAAMMSSEVVGPEIPVSKVASEWEFQSDAVESKTLSNEKLSDLSSVEIAMEKRIVIDDNWDEGKYPGAFYASYFTEGTIEELTHISLNYKTNAPIIIRLYTKDQPEDPREVLLNSVGPDVQSGKIPLTAFDYSQYFEEDPATGLVKKPLIPSEIIGIGIAPQVVGVEKESVKFSVTNMKLYGKLGETSISQTNNSSKIKTGIMGIENSALKLSIAEAGNYSISLYSLNGRMIQSFQNYKMASGITSLKLNSLSTGIYMIKVSNLKTNKEITKSTLVL